MPSNVSTTLCFVLKKDKYKSTAFVKVKQKQKSLESTIHGVTAFLLSVYVAVLSSGVGRGRAIGEDPFFGV